MGRIRFSSLLFWMAALFFCMLSVCGCASVSESRKPGRTLVVYYSNGDDGIRELAQAAAKAAQCHLFEIQPDKDYAPLLEKLESGTELSADELEDLFSPNFKLVQPVPDNWKAYDRILLGCPLWLDGAPAPVRLFLEQNDLSDKTFQVFTIGTQSQADALQEQLSSQNAHQGFTRARAFKKEFSPDEVKDWIRP